MFFRRMVSNSAWERLSELERRSRRLDGPALYSDLSLLSTARYPLTFPSSKCPPLTRTVTRTTLSTTGPCARTCANSVLFRDARTRKGGARRPSFTPGSSGLMILSTWRERCVLE